jgi:hypothetical protein
MQFEWVTSEKKWDVAQCCCHARDQESAMQKQSIRESKEQKQSIRESMDRAGGIRHDRLIRLMNCCETIRDLALSLGDL